VEHVLRASERLLGVDYPFLPIQSTEEFTECARLPQRLKGPVEFEFAAPVENRDRVDELAAEHAAEHLDGKEESVLRSNPAGAVRRESAFRDDVVNVRMVAPTPTIP
jgi:hypothetical protein